ncbi:MAG: hypothetical protein V1779_17265 [bacterium]
MMMKFYVILFFMVNLLNAQQNQPTPGTSSKPLELPNFIIEGKEQVDVRSGIKQFPEKPLAMSQDNLDSLNSLEKQQSLLLPPQPLPNKILNSDYKKGYAMVGIGRFAFANVEAGYEYDYKEYSFFANAGLDYSGEHVANSGYNKFHLNLFTDYIAPDKFFIFGGSKTRSTLKINQTNYNLYAVENPVERSIFNLNLGIESDGNYSNFSFSTGANFRTLQLSDFLTDSIDSKAFDNLLSGYIMVKNLGHDYELGGKVKADLESVCGNGVHYFEAGLFGSFKIGKITINLESGLQFGGTSNDVSRGGLLIKAIADYQLNEKFTIKASVFTGLRKVMYFDIIEINPFTQRSAGVDYIYDTPMLKGMLYYHPLENIGLSAGLTVSSSDRTPVFDTLTVDAFTLKYERVNKIDLFSEGFYKITAKDNITYYGAFDYSTLSNNGNIAPYNPLLKLSIDYNRKLLEDKLDIVVGFNYIGKRYADFNNEIALDGYIDLRLKFAYKLLEDFNIQLRLENLLNSDIYIWQDYKERGLFFGLGAYYQF